MHHDRAGLGANDAGHIVADSNGHVPPTFGPGAHAARGPHIGILVQTIVGGLWHRAQTVRDQIDSLVENGKFTAPLKKLISQQSSSEDDDLIYHREVS